MAAELSSHVTRRARQPAAISANLQTARTHATAEGADDAVPLAEPNTRFQRLMVRQTIHFGRNWSGTKTGGPAFGGPVELSIRRTAPAQETAGSRPSDNRRRYGCR